MLNILISWDELDSNQRRIPTNLQSVLINHSSTIPLTSKKPSLGLEPTTLSFRNLCFTY